MQRIGLAAATWLGRSMRKGRPSLIAAVLVSLAFEHENDNVKRFDLVRAVRSHRKGRK